MISMKRFHYIIIIIADTDTAKRNEKNMIYEFEQTKSHGQANRREKVLMNHGTFKAAAAVYDTKERLKQIQLSNQTPGHIAEVTGVASDTESAQLGANDSRDSKAETPTWVEYNTSKNRIRRIANQIPNHSPSKISPYLANGLYKSPVKIKRNTGI